MTKENHYLFWMFGKRVQNINNQENDKYSKYFYTFVKTPSNSGELQKIIAKHIFDGYKMRGKRGK